jgi:transcriptional regulator with XRE-family HTH domain
MKSNEALRLIADVSSYQWGMVTTAQAEALGVGRVDLARMTRAQLLVRLAHGVYRDAGAPIDEFEDLRAAWLSTEPKLSASRRADAREHGVVVSGASAAELHRIGDLRPERHEFTTRERRQTQRRELHYRQRDLEPEDVTLVDGLPATTLERTIADLIEARTDFSLVANAFRDAARRTRLNTERLALLLSPLAARNGFAADDGASFLEHLASTAGLDLTALARHIAATDELALRVSVEFLSKAAREYGLSAEQLDSLRAARKSSRLTQRQLAMRARVDQAAVSRSEGGRDAEFATVDHLLAGAGHRLYSAPTRRDDVATVAAEIRQQLRAGDKDRALRALIQLNDNLVAEHGLVRGVLGLAEPESTNDPVWDAALAALVAWRLGEEGLPAPDWVDAPRRFLSQPRGLGVDAADPIPSKAEVPDEFAQRGVLVWRDTFASV